jgi:hypothetical protein
VREMRGQQPPDRGDAGGDRNEQPDRPVIF